MRISKISAHVQNICAYLKYLRISKIYAPHSNKADVEKSAHIKNICAHQKIGAQTLTIWARQNLYFWLLPSLAAELSFRWCCLSSMQSSSDVSTQAAQLIWAASPVLYRLLYRHDLPKYLRPVQNICGSVYFPHFLGKNQKLNSAHKCPITSLQIRT